MAPAFVLFVARDSPNSRAAVANLNRALRSLARAPAEVEIVDVQECPDVAAGANILVTPTLLRRSDPRARIVGDLSVFDKLLDFLI